MRSTNIVLSVLALALVVLLAEALPCNLGTKDGYSALARNANTPKNCDRTANCYGSGQVANFCPSTNAKFRETCFIPSLPSGILTAVDKLLPETKHPDQALINSDIFVYYTAGEDNNLTISFLQSISSANNRMGYNFYQNGLVGNMQYAIPRTNSINRDGCLRAGDSFRFGPFGADTMLVFFLENGGERYWSYFGTGISNTANDVRTCGAPGCKHSAWAFLPEFDITIFGWEDYYAGDWDYNDLVYFLNIEGNGYYNEVPTYENGTILVCNNASIVSWNSFADINCQSWGLLESATSSSSCLTYLPIPSGWTWAPNDEISKAAILASSAQWSYTGSSTCYLLMNNATSGVGWNVSSSGTLQPCTAPVKYIASGSRNGYCYNTECTARYVLKSLTQSVACASVTRCNSGSPGLALSYAPSKFSEGVVTIPDTVTTLVATGTGSVPVNASIQLLSDKKIDIVVLTDFFVDSTSSSGSSQRVQIDNSWSSVASSFRSLSLSAQFAVVSFVPSSNDEAASYTLSSDYTFTSTPAALPTSAFHRVSCGTSASAQLRRGRNLVSALNTVANSPSLNWRSDSYRIVWIPTLCNLPVDGSSSTTGVTIASIQKLTGIVPIVSNGGTGTSSFQFNAGAAPTTYSVYNSGGSSTWDAPFRSYSYNPQRGAFLMSQFMNTFQVVPSQGDVDWFANIPTTPTTLNSGTAVINYNVAWPTGLSVDTTTLYFRASLRIIGRDTISYLIYFNHAPTLPAYTTSMTTAQSSITFTLSPTDLDQGNKLNLIVTSAPTKGTLTTTTSSTALTQGTALDYSVFTLVYTPNDRDVTYTETFDMSVDDGCKQATARVSISVPSINRPPTALPIVLNLNEDDATSASISLASFISDLDTADTVTAVLSSDAAVTSGNLRIGNIQSSTGTNYAAGDFIPRATSLRYANARTGGYSGFGTIVVSYRAYDGRVYSAPSTITINVWHKNHPPAISTLSSVVNQYGESVSWTISVSDLDYYLSNETAKIEIISSQWQSGTDAYTIENWANSAAITFNGAATHSSASPFAFSPVSAYTASTNITVSGSSINFNGYSWNAPLSGGSNPTPQSITIRAVDSTGAQSAPTTITFKVSDDNPPTWIAFPAVVNPAEFQGHNWTDLYFAATDIDGKPQMEAFIFTVLSVPSHGSAYLQAPDGSTSAAALTLGQTFSIATHGSYVAYNAATSPARVEFHVTYRSSRASFGQSSLIISVTDSTSLTASPSASAVITTLRKPTPPVSSNFVINGLENELIPFSIPAQSTNDVSFPVEVILLSLNFRGAFYEGATGTDAWFVGSNSTDSVTGSGGSLPGQLIGNFGYYQLPSTSAFATPGASFTFRVYEAENNLLSDVYTATIQLTHVNHPPTTRPQTNTIKKRELLNVTLPVDDPDADDTEATLKVNIVSVTPFNGGPAIFFDKELKNPVNSASMAAGTPLEGRTFWYQSNDLYDSSRPLMVYQFTVTDQHNATSDPEYGYIYVNAAGDLPIVGTNRTTTPQETPVPMNLASDVTTESGQIPTVVVTSQALNGQFSYCEDSGACTKFTVTPFTLPSASGRVVYEPQPHDWGTDFASFTYTLTDPGTKAVGFYTMIIDVFHVNKAPSIRAANFLTTSQSSSGLVINESEWRSFDWYANDVDDLPSTLITEVRVNFYTTQGFSLFNCSATTSGWNVSATECSFNSTADVPLAVRADFAKNALLTVDSFSVVDSDCTDANALKLRRGTVSRNCEARFKFAFVPTPFASYTPYITISWTAVDPSNSESSTISALIFVKAVNNPPTIWAPSQVVGVSGITNPFLRDTAQSSATYNDPITVADVDANGNKEQMTFQVVSGNGNFTFPSAAPCVYSTDQWVCTDFIGSFNQWLTDVRFNVTSGDRATLRFVINDLGHSGDWKPSPQLSANATTVVIISAAIAAPKGNSSTLAIAVGVAAGAGLLLLGALGFFLRNAISPPSDDYFSAATAPISAAPQSPLYQAQNTEHMSPLYKGIS